MTLPRTGYICNYIIQLSGDPYGMLDESQYIE